MKLIFPNGERGQVLLSDGSNRVGSADDADVRIDAAGVQPDHCELALEGNVATLRPRDGASVTVNGEPVGASAQARPGDVVAFAGVQARVVAVERAGQSPSPPRPKAVDDNSATRVRMAVPRFVLRGVSGVAFGKTYPVGKELVIGRQHDCDIPVPAEEVSRHHVRIKPTPDGVLVEDLNSANGTYIDGKRVQSGLLKPGGELRLDTIRFLLIAPGAEIAKAAAAPAEPVAGSRGAMPWIIGAVVLVAIAVAIYALR